MSYPKRHPKDASPDLQALKKQQKRDQLKQILINKFRGKYNIKADIDDLDRYLKDEVEAIIASNNMSETALVDLDKRLQ